MSMTNPQIMGHYAELFEYIINSSMVSCPCLVLRQLFRSENLVSNSIRWCQVQLSDHTRAGALSTPSIQVAADTH